MAMEFKRRLPIPMEIREEMPLSAELTAKKQAFDAEVAKVFTGEDARKVLIIGPCSADREDSVLEYMNRLAKVTEEVKDKLIIIPRVYTNKPRTKGTGYKGLLHNPDPEAPDDLLEGVKAIRHMHLRVIEETGFFTADEMLYPDNHRYLSDLLSYVAVGARSVENQQHRLTASGLDVPVGLKNPTGGDLSIMMNAITAGHHSHTFIYRGWEVESLGNPLSHAILRGFQTTDGQNVSNYHYEDLVKLNELYQKSGLENPAVIVDTNHSNSGKKFREQPRIALDVIHSMRENPDIKKLCKGLMIESYIEDGAQKTDGDVYGRSITDPCLGWEKTEKLIFEIADKL